VPPLPRPVYLHAEPCRGYADTGTIPVEYQGQPLTFEAFGSGREGLAELRVEGSEDQAVKELLERPEVRYSTRGAPRRDATCSAWRGPASRAPSPAGRHGVARSW
jgi:hypothetical protein